MLRLNRFLAAAEPADGDEPLVGLAVGLAATQVVAEHASSRDEEYEEQWDPGCDRVHG